MIHQDKHAHCSVSAFTSCAHEQWYTRKCASVSSTGKKTQAPTTVIITWLIFYILLGLNELGVVVRVSATKAVFKALARDAFIIQDDGCKASANVENTLISRTYASSGLESNFDDINIAKEPDLFYIEVKSNPDSISPPTSDQAFTLRVGRGGQLYSMNGAYGEAMPPNVDLNAVFVRDVMQAMVIDTGSGSINQAGSQIRSPANDDMAGNPFWSPNVGPALDAFSLASSAVDCTYNSCRVLSWGQPYQIDSNQSGSSALFYTRFSHCGNGVIEVTNLMHNMADAPSIRSGGSGKYPGAGTFRLLSSPAINLRHSTFQDVRSGNDTSLLSDPSAVPAYASPIINMIDTTTGFTVFTEQEIPASTSDVPLPCASSSGTKVDCSDTNLSPQEVNLVLDPDRACIVQASATSNLGRTVINCFLDQSILSVAAEFGYETRYDPITLVDTSEGGVNLDTQGIWYWARRGRYLMFLIKDGEETLANINAKLGYGADGRKRSTLGVVFDAARVTVAGKSREECKAVAIVHGTTSAANARGKTYTSLGRDLPERNDALKFTVQHRMNVSPGETYVDRHYIINDALTELMNTTKASQWSSATRRQKFAVTDDIGEYHAGSGRGIALVKYKSQDDYYANLLDTEYETCSMSSSALSTCQGYSVPRANHYAYFFVECGPDQYYTGPDRYHFTPPPSETGGILKPYLCSGYESDPTIRPKITLLGFFPDDGTCAYVSNLRLDYVACLRTSEPPPFAEDPITISSVAPSSGPSAVPPPSALRCDFDDGVKAPNDGGSLTFLMDLAADDDAGNLATPWNYIPVTDVAGAEPFYVRSSSGVIFYIRPIYYSSLPYQGAPCTRVFAWLSTPFEDLSASPVPGAVLVHGRGGTAFKLWCEQWAARDMASIAIAHEGQTDIKLPIKDEYDRAWERHSWPGPFHVGRAYSDAHSGTSLNDQWMYHAVAQTILANTLLRHEPNVNANHVGITGVSWGGVITSTVIGLDSRFAFAIPAYGCGSLGDSMGHIGRQINLSGESVTNYYNSVWDPVLRFGNIQHNLPTLWISYPKEAHFPLPDQADTYESLLAQSSTATAAVLLIPDFSHGHSFVWNRKENYEFVKNALSNSSRPLYAKQVEPFPIVSLPTSANENVTVWFDSTQEFSKATLISSVNETSVNSSLRTWSNTVISEIGKVDTSCSSSSTSPPSMCRWYATATIPLGTTSWYVHLCTTASYEVCVSSFYQETSIVLS